MDAPGRDPQVGAWKRPPEEEKKNLRERGKRIGRTGYNLFVSEHMARARAEAEARKAD